MRFLLLLAAPLAALPALGGCSDSCSNTTVTQLDAPGGQHSVTLFQRDCGASTGFTTQISIHDRGSAPSGRGNIFVADADHGAAAVGDWGGPWAEMRWLAPDHLQIRYAEKSRIFNQIEQRDGIRISYEAVAR